MEVPPLPGVEQLYDVAPCGLLVAGSDGHLLHANSTACQWLRYAREELLAKVRLQDLMTMGGRIFWQTHLQPLLRMQSSVAEVKLDLKRQDGSTLPMIVNIVERAWSGQVLLQIAFFVAEDRHKYERELLLQRKRAEELAAQHARDQEELQAARAHAEERSKFAEQLVGVVSHDIRNPLSVIHMSTVLLERGVGPEQQKAAVARVARAVQRVQHLIGDLLDFTQARVGGGLTIRKAPIDIHQVMADAASELQVAFPQCTVRHERSGPGHCQADADRLVQAVGNLVANAANHGAAQRPITIRTEGGDGVVRIHVHNEGAPIPPDVMPRLFEPLVRGAGAMAQGVGLGLFIVRAIGQAHGGSVSATSNATEGTTFTLSLPSA
ncbi:MAG TPA: PAS domain-containing sensor histidine kinase [Ramlibacter sp.]|jgi:sigma-B regulation protein RsbU (phosphoserine phosphatase)|nr:PAS domain-containing sensor histidine kinase [Ramlibacter sp.]